MKTIFLDMYGVIIKESKGNFIPYTYAHFVESEHERITTLFRTEKLFTKAGNGEITSDELLTHIGFSNPAFYMRDYIENHLTIDEDFYTFAESCSDRYFFTLLSNDVSAWSNYITEYYDLNKYFLDKTVSADVGCRKPDRKIFEIALKNISALPKDCIFIDNSVQNLKAAESLGMDTILFNRDNEKYDGKTVYSFKELSYLL